MRITVIALMGIGLSLSACKKDEKKAEPPKEAPAVTPTDEPAVVPAEQPADTALVDRGRYLSDLMGCEHCHTSEGAKPFSGGQVGPAKAPNITQDKETGIGGWTDEQIIAAVREGKRPDGQGFRPFMPSRFYNVLSDDDAKALVAFVRTIEPVANKVELSELPMPPIPPAPAKGMAASPDDPVAYGEYLTTLMHCVGCHTPMGEAGPDQSKRYAGGMKLGPFVSTNITPHKTGIGDWSDDEVIAAFVQMKKRDGSLIKGPMAPYQKGWSQIEEKDAKAVVAYLRSLPPIENAIVAVPPGEPAKK